ncbi:hypothetical protein HZI73_02630 [Vallitalea pronyensis]|uniref:Flagellar hook-length control protein-like C-terminal domain-containing protein n=1 Tax=Vallitalea pronyensis TaxID=1348613 RepID=A0A8J8MH58_9FIRM|nr:DUF6240 domain-containing protein [Vallitalea pronyensis]QUI21243.1 hypothetical protein HZI73_02630 [Vallitalea pronyensis]
MNSVTSIYSSRITIDEPVKKNMGFSDDIITGIVMEKNDKGTLVDVMGKEILVPPSIDILEEKGEACTFKVEKHGEDGIRLKYETHAPNQSVPPKGQSYMKAWLKRQNMPDFSYETLNALQAMGQDEQTSYQKLIKETKEQLDKILDKAVDEDILKLLSKNMSPEKMTIKLFEHAITKEKSEGQIEKKEVKDIVEKELNRLAKIFGSKEEMRSIVKKLKEKNLPVTEANIFKIRGALNKFDAIKELKDEAILNVLKNNIALTVEKIYEAKYSSGQVAEKENTYGQHPTTGQPHVSEETLQALEPQIKKILEDNQIPLKDENIEAAKTFIRHGMEITKENMTKYMSLKHIAEDMDKEQIIQESVQNIIDDKHISDISIMDQEAADFKGIDAERLIEDIPKIRDKHIERLIKRGMDISLYNLQKLVHKDPLLTSPSHEPEAILSENEQQHMITAKRQLEEIRLKMTLESANRFIKHQIQIDTAPLEKVVEDLRQLEALSYRQALTAVGVKPSTERISQMREVMDTLSGLKQSSAHVLGKVYQKEIEFTLKALSQDTSQNGLYQQQPMEMYEKLGTKPRGDLGDYIGKAFGQLEGILKDLGIQPTPEHVRASKILAHNEIEINDQNINHIKFLDQKVTEVLTKLHPTVVASMLKDNISPLGQTIDEVLQYMNDFQDDNGEDLTEKIAKYIHSMDQAGDLSKEERESMIGIYRMLHTIAKSEGRAVGFLAKHDMKLTLNNLMEAAKYIRRTGGKRTDMNITIDDNFGGLEELRYHGKPITQQIQEAFEKTSMTTTKGNRQFIEQMMELDLDITADGLIHMKELENTLKEFILKATPSGLKKILEQENIMDKPIEEVLEFLENSQDEQIVDTQRIREQLMVAKEASSKAIAFLEKLQLPINLKNLHTMGQLMQDNHVLSKQLKKVLDTTDHQHVLTEDMKAVIGDVIEQLGQGQDMDTAYAELQKKIDDIEEDNRFKMDGQQSVEYICTDIKRMLDMNQILGDQENFLQVPIILNGEISQLNMYYINEQKADDEPLKVLVSLDTKHLGTVHAYVEMQDDHLHVQMSSSIEEETNYLEGFDKDLRNVLEGMGFSHVTMTYGENKVKAPIDVREDNMPNTARQHLAMGHFEQRI